MSVVPNRVIPISNGIDYSAEEADSHMKISQMRYFTTIAKLQNMSKASVFLHTSQSSLSKNISSIESELNTTLFDRYGKHIVLNSAGQRFLECCNNVLREYDSTVEDINLIMTGSGHRIRIGSCGSINKLMQCMTSFKSEHPEVEFDINSELDGEEHIDINEFDVLVYPAESKYSRFAGYPLYTDGYFLAVTKSHPLYGEAAVSSRTLKGLNVVFLRIGKSAEYPYNICTALSIPFATQSFVNSRSMHRDMVASGLAVGFVPESCASMYRAMPGIRLLPITDNSFSRDYNICFRRKKHLSNLAQRFEEYTMEYFKIVEEDDA